MRFVWGVMVRVVARVVVWFGKWPCWVVGHRWVLISKGRVGLCRKCNGFFRIGKRGRVLERLEEPRANRKMRRAMTKGLRQYA